MIFSIVSLSKSAVFLIGVVVYVTLIFIFAYGTTSPEIMQISRSMTFVFILLVLMMSCDIVEPITVPEYHRKVLVNVCECGHF